jgi:hypothetical protein
MTGAGTMPFTDPEEQKWVENEVRRVARQLWPEAQYGGAQVIDGLERDGVFETEDCIHLLEATVSRRKDKALEDSKKLANLARKFQIRNPQKAVKCWFVTKDEPTADQRDAINQRTGLVVALSFAQFQSKLIDVAFGSVRDPATGSAKVEIEVEKLAAIYGQTLAEFWGDVKPLFERRGPELGLR